MANPAVDKLKDFGLRQGEKFVVGTTALVLAFGVYYLATKPTIELTPQALATKAEQADSNLSRKQEVGDIRTKIEEAGIKDPGFVTLVENQAKNTLKPDDYRARLDWVTPEPGAGLIRDQPELIAPTELLAFPGRGGMLLYALDDKGERILDTSPTAATGRRPGKGGLSMGVPPSGSEGGGPPNGVAGGASLTAEQKAAQDREKARRELALGGAKATPKKDEEKKAGEAEGAPAAPEGPYKEVLTGKRWVTLIAVVDNETMNKNWLTALKNPAIAFPQYVRVDVERQSRQGDSPWSDWAKIDDDARYRVLENMPEADEELVPSTRLLPELVDQLPLLQAGYWTGVHVRRLVPDDKLAAPTPNMGPGGGKGMMSGPGGMSMGVPPSGGPGGMGGESMSGPGGGMSGVAPMGGPGAGGSGMGGAEEQVVANNEPALMIRSLDFAVDPNVSYRYRMRLVVKNPNFERNDVNPGVDTTNKLLTGPWSATTEPVTVRANVSAYAQNPIDNPRRNGSVMFQVVAWDPNKGFTVVKTDEASPGQMIGEEGGVQMPTTDGKPVSNATVDFNSRSVVLDVQGGRQRVPDLGVDQNQFDRNQFVVPVVATVIEPDGSVVVRNQARDIQDEVRKDMEANYQQAIKDSGQAKRSGSGSMMMGVPPSS